jgi:hypothetical protein
MNEGMGISSPDHKDYNSDEEDEDEEIGNDNHHHLRNNDFHVFREINNEDEGSRRMNSEANKMLSHTVVAQHYMSSGEEGEP